MRLPPTPLAGDLGGGLPAQFRVRPDSVVVLLPGRQDGPGLSQRGEQGLVQPGILILERAQAFGLRHLQTTELRLPLVEGRRTDPVAAADIRRRRPSLLLPQYPNNLLFAEPATLNPSVSSRAGLYLITVTF